MSAVVEAEPTTAAWLTARPYGLVAESVRRRLEPIGSGGWRSWAAAGWVVAIAAILRLIKLSFPPQIMVDEVYYANQAQQLLDHGIEWRYDTDSAGNAVGPGGADPVIVHPPLGKWIIALGIRLTQFDSFGWRLMPAVFGILAVLILTRTARRMFRSTALGAMAGLLMALDGMEFVLSRAAFLDIFVMFFVLIAFACLVLDRDQRRRRWLRELEFGLDPTRPGATGRPVLDWRAVPWWRLAAGVLLGAGCGVKWSVVFFIPVFVALTFWWEVGLRRTVGVRHPWRDTLLDESGWLVALVGLAGAAYLATWTGWFVTDHGIDRHYLRDTGHAEPWLFGALDNLWQYHVRMYHESLSITSPHTYQSEPWQWLLLGRPFTFYVNGDPTCGASRCEAEILLLGTPVLWWSFIPALVLTAWFGISRRDWRALPIWAGAATGILPWFAYVPGHRTMYYFYALPAEPFLVLAVTYVFGCLITGPGVGRFGYGRVRSNLVIPATDRRLYGVIAAGVFVTLVAICFWIYYPLYVGDSIPYDDWSRRMLLGNRWV